MAMAYYTIIYNPMAGHKTADKVAARIAKRLEAAHHSVSLKPTKGPDDAQALAFSATGDIVVAMGGDGTINQVVAGLIKRRRPPLLGIIPQGTVNNLARQLNIPLLPDLAAVTLLRGRVHPLDVGVINQDHVMISSLTLGVTANAALSVSQQEKQRFGPLAFVAKGLNVFLRHQHWQLTLTSPHHQWQRDTQMVLIMMTQAVGGFLKLAPGAKVDDGLFHVFVVPKPSWGRAILTLPALMTGRYAKLPGMTYFATNQLTITSASLKKPLQSRIDGDPSAALPLAMQVEGKKIQVLVPPASHLSLNMLH